MTTLRVAPEVASALSAGRPVVALETTIFSRLGLPEPAGRDCLTRVLSAVRQEGAVPAATAVVDGEARVGLDEAGLARVFGAGRKLAERDLPAALARREPCGVTTVSAALALAARAGIAVFATGGIGGVHRGAGTSDDVSADLSALARHPVVTVSAGAKAFLDLGRTLERLETLSVPVIGYRTGDFPAFWSRSSGLPVPARAESAGEVAAIVRAARSLGWSGGLLVANPVPAEAEVPAGEIAEAIAEGIAEAERTGATGGAVTPVVLAAIARRAGPRALAANVALAESNARLAAAIARSLAAEAPAA